MGAGERNRGADVSKIEIWCTWAHATTAPLKSRREREKLTPFSREQLELIIFSLKFVGFSNAGRGGGRTRRRHTKGEVTQMISCPTARLLYGSIPTMLVAVAAGTVVRCCLIFSSSKKRTPTRTSLSPPPSLTSSPFVHPSPPLSPPPVSMHVGETGGGGGGGTYCDYVCYR